MPLSSFHLIPCFLAHANPAMPSSSLNTANSSHRKALPLQFPLNRSNMAHIFCMKLRLFNHSALSSNINRTSKRSSLVLLSNVGPTHASPCHSFLFLFFFFWSFLGPSSAYGDSQARGWNEAVAAGRRHSHSNARSEACLWPTPQLTTTPDPSSTEQGQGLNLQPHGS